MLTELRDDLQAIQQAAAGSARIRAFLQTDRQTRLAKNVPAFKAIRDFKENGSLDLYQKIHGFVTYPATPFVQRAGGDLTAQLGDAARQPQPSRVLRRHALVVDHTGPYGDPAALRRRLSPGSRQPSDADRFGQGGPSGPSELEQARRAGATVDPRAV